MNLPSYTPDPAIDSLMEIAKPYDVRVKEDKLSSEVVVTLADSRKMRGTKFGDSKVTRFVNVRISEAKLYGGNDPLGVYRRAVLSAKERLQKTLAEHCDEPAIRLWAAQKRNVDLMDNSAIPNRIRTGYEQWLKESSKPQVTVRKKREPQREDVPSPRMSRRVRRIPQTENLPKKTEEKETEMPPKIVRGAKTKSVVRKPLCRDRRHDEPVEMVFSQETALWECPDKDCLMTARPKGDNPPGSVLLGKGSLDIRVIFQEPGNTPSLILMADNNVALDITDYVDMQKFMGYSHARDIAKAAAEAGKDTTEINARNVGALLMFRGAKIYGCGNA